MSEVTIGSRYIIQDKLGSGGMGTVYRAYDRLSAESVAIKRIGTLSTSALDGTEAELSYRRALAQEFHVLATMRHPHIISVLDYGFEEQQPYYVMELLHDAENLLAYSRKQPQQVRLALLVQVAQGIAYLHRRGILHRDLKPDNILVVQGQTKILDFGLATAHEAAADSDDLAGTLNYMPPEMFSGQPNPSFASDWYAFGVIAYEMLEERHPFQANDIASFIANVTRATVEFHRDDLPLPVRQVIERLLSKDPLDRYQDAAAFIGVLAEAANLTHEVETAHIRESYLQAARFVGRTRELGLLADALEVARIQKRGSLWLVGGESGVGKSRLMEEVRSLALVNGVIVLRGQAIVEGGAPYLLWRSVLRNLCLRVPLSPLERGVLQALVPDVGTLLGVQVDPPPDLEPQAAQDRLLLTVEEVFRRHDAPTLIILEDLQWAEESLTILSRLARSLEQWPLIIIGTYRDDESSALPSLFPAARAIRLKRLSDSEIADLSASILGSDIGRQKQFVQLLHNETEGNAFFIVEIIRSLAEQAGQLANLGQMTIPNSVLAGGIRTVIEKRLKNVPSAALNLLRTMAVAGRELDLRLLAQLAPSLDQEAWLLSCSSVLDVLDNQWRFAHDKLREAILAQLGSSQAAAEHRRVALALEALYGEDEAYLARLVFHWHEAADLAQEARTSALLGQQHLRRGGYAEAVRYLERALLLEKSSPSAPYQASHIVKLLGDAYLGLGRLEESYDHFRQALKPLGHRTPGQRASQLALTALELARQLRHRLLPTPPGRASAYYRDAANASNQMSIIHYFLNQKSLAFYYGLKSLNLAARADDRQEGLLSNTQATFAVMASIMPLYGMAQEYTRLAQRQLPSPQQAGLRSWVLLMGGIYATNTADWAVALHSLRECLALAESSGNIRRLQESVLALAAAHFFKGDWDESYQLAEKLLMLGEEFDSIQCRAWALDDLGRILYHRGENARALELFMRSQQLYQQIQDRSGLIWVHGALAQVHTRLGQLEQARPYAEPLRQWLSSTPPGQYGLLEGYQGLADFHLAQYEASPTPAHRQAAQEAVQLITQFGRIFNTGKSYRHLDAAWLLALQGQEGRSLRETGLAIREAQRYGLRYEEGLAAYHAARLLPESHPQRPAYLDSARRILGELGASWELSRLEG